MRPEQTSKDKRRILEEAMKGHGTIVFKSGKFQGRTVLRVQIIVVIPHNIRMLQSLQPSRLKSKQAVETAPQKTK